MFLLMPRRALPTSASGARSVPTDERWQSRVRVLLAVALDLSGEHDLDAVLGRIVQGAAAVADARYAALGIYDTDGRIIRFVHHGLDDETVRQLGDLPEGRGLLGEVIVADGPIRLDDIADHPRSAGFPPGHPPMRTFLDVPVVRGGRRHGNLYLTEKVGGTTFDDDDEALVVCLAAFATGAIESALLVEEERLRTEAVAAHTAAEERGRVREEMLGHVIDAQEAERARVSRDLHDDIGQALTSVLLGLRLVDASLYDGDRDADEAGRRLADLRELVRDALQRSRQLAFDLRPTVLDDIGLVPALERLTSDIAARAELAVELANGLSFTDRLDPAIETVAYRVVQEALTNVVRHAEASTVRVALATADRRLHVTIIDDGCGFDTTVQARHLGLSGMTERANLAGGDLTVASRPGTGTTITLEVPVD